MTATQSENIRSWYERQKNSVVAKTPDSYYDNQTFEITYPDGTRERGIVASLHGLCCSLEEFTARTANGDIYEISATGTFRKVA